MEPSKPETPRIVFPRSPEKECDLVMKGGITSGVVYPPAILDLAHQYRFRNIGGASAGAIAAATAGASEYGRQTRPEDRSAGFYRLHGVKEELDGPGFLTDLFQPAGKSRALFEAGLALKKGSDKLKAVRSQDDRKERQAERIQRQGDRVAPSPFARPPRYRPGRWLTLLGRIRRGQRKTTRALRWWRLVNEVLAKHAAEGYERGTQSGTMLGLLMAALLLWPLVFGPILYGALGARLVFSLLLIVLAVVLAQLGGRLGALVGAVLYLKQEVDFVRSPQSFFGICPGSAEPGALPAGREPLTDWLHRRLNEMAGLSPQGDPLTIRQLDEHNIVFRLVTTDLSCSLPMVLPWKDQTFFFREEDLRRLFPKPVMDYLIRKSHAYQTQSLETQSLETQSPESPPPPPLPLPPPGFHRFPAGRDLPVVVATRLSLSFPILLCAVPLYTYKPDTHEAVKKAQDAHTRYALREEDLQLHWFSDGGIANNFPIHFFDAWFPLRPTFGITLADSLVPTHMPLPKRPHSTTQGHAQEQKLPENLQDLRRPGLRRALNKNPSVDRSALEDSVMVPLASAFDKVLLPVQPIGDLVGFFSALLDTARNYRDNTQAILPGYRERIATVFLGPDEGGLNLDMDPKTIQRMGLKGMLAGELLQKMNFREHQWVRMVILFARLEDELSQMRDKPGPNARTVDEIRQEYETILREMEASMATDHAFYEGVSDPAWNKQAHQRVDALLTFLQSWENLQEGWRHEHPERQAPAKTEPPPFYHFFSELKLQPESVLRITPEL